MEKVQAKPLIEKKIIYAGNKNVEFLNGTKVWQISNYIFK